MMWYNGPRHHSYYRRYGGPRGRFRFPWLPLPFLFFFFAGSHLWWLLITGLIVMFLFIAFQRAWSTTSSRNQQTNYNPSQQTYYQPPVQRDAQPYYQPYQQGYQAPVVSSEQEYYKPEQEQEGPYQAYDQPKAEYPQQMPPM